ncbi:hypothetical protein FGO68_gene17530 [Halteria grandinella]|uniref:Uncharacterized protein n=1 Tax=Halteria grandinella TaxID=5974 RepID=A0A8J8T681_HALGN|nr:hypothetical protein FGO68_gene17530 [Halteria grandinella]
MDDILSNEDANIFMLISLIQGSLEQVNEKRQSGRVVQGASFRRQSERAWVRTPPLSDLFLLPRSQSIFVEILQRNQVGKSLIQYIRKQYSQEQIAKRISAVSTSII